MAQGPCPNPHCGSQGKPHPNCKCYSNMADGGKATEYCAHGMPHMKDCEYYAEGGAVAPDFIPDSEFSPDAKASPDFIPDSQFTPDSGSSAEQEANANQAKETALQSKYGTSGQMAKAGLEAIGQGAAGPLATAYETAPTDVVSSISSAIPVVGPALGLAKEAIGQVNPEDIRGREEANPIIHGAGTVAGLMVPGGEGSLLEKAGAKVLSGVSKGAAKLGVDIVGEGVLKGATRGAVKLAAENALYQSGDEVSKMIKEDPNQTVGSAIANVGLAGLIGFGGGTILGSVSPLWKASLGEKAENLVSDFKARMREHLELPEETPVESVKETYDPFMKQSVPEGASPKAMAEEAPISKVEQSSSKIEQKEIKPLDKTDGGKLADLFIKHADKLGGKALAGAIGAAIGHATTIPYAGTIGAILGERALGPILESVLPVISKPIVEKLVSGEGLKAAVEYGTAAVKGANLADSAIKNVIKGVSKIIPDAKQPTQKDREKINTSLSTYQTDPTKITSIGGSIGHYLPEHAMAIGAMASNAVQFLNSIKPQTVARAPLDPPRVIPEAVQAQYDRVLDIAQQPLVVLQSIKDNTLTSHDVIALHTLYPQLYAGLRQKVMNQIVDHISSGEEIPYDIRLGLSMFLQQPLDSTMSPMAISSAQPSPQQQAPQQAKNAKMTQGAANNMIKGSKAAQTQSQASEAMHSSGAKA